MINWNRYIHDNRVIEISGIDRRHDAIMVDEIQHGYTIFSCKHSNVRGVELNKHGNSWGVSLYDVICHGDGVQTILTFLTDKCSTHYLKRRSGDVWEVVKFEG